MADRGVAIIPSHNYATRRVRCGVSGQLIEKGAPTIHIACRRGRDCKPESVLRTVMRVILRGEQERGWEPVIASTLGQEVRLIGLPNDNIVLVGNTVVYTEVGADRVFSNEGWPVSRIANSLAKALHTEVQGTDLTAPAAFPEFMAEHGISTEEWTYFQLAVAVLGISEEEVRYG